jgi:hypothetical protein
MDVLISPTVVHHLAYYINLGDGFATSSSSFSQTAFGNADFVNKAGHAQPIKVM